MLLVLAPFVAYLIGLVVLVNDIRAHTFHSGSFVGWFAVAGLLALVEYVFFLVFAFSEWPALRQRGPRNQRGFGYPPAGPPHPYSPYGGRPGPGAAYPPSMPSRPGPPLSARPGFPLNRGGGWSDPWYQASDSRIARNPTEQSAAERPAPSPD